MLEDGFKKAFIKEGFVRGVIEADSQPKAEIDGAVLETFNFGIINDPLLLEKNIQKLDLLKTPSGGYRRNTGAGDYEAHEFLFIDFNLSRVLQKFGRKIEAEKILGSMVDKSCQDNGLIPEMYVSQPNRGSAGEKGDPSGAIPVVCYGAGVYAMALSEREQR